MFPENANPYDILLAGIYAGFALAAILTGLILKVYGLRGLPVGLLANAVMQITFLTGLGFLDRGQVPPLGRMILAILYFILLTFCMTFIVYITIRKKQIAPEFLTGLALFITSIFAWEFYIPAIFALVILLLPEREKQVLKQFK